MPRNGQCISQLLSHKTSRVHCVGHNGRDPKCTTAKEYHIIINCNSKRMRMSSTLTPLLSKGGKWWLNTSASHESLFRFKYAGSLRLFVIVKEVILIKGFFESLDILSCLLRSSGVEQILLFHTARARSVLYTLS